MHRSTLVNIYIYTSVNPCITCTKQGGAEQKTMPINDEQGAAFFERPFRAQETNAPHGCGLERNFSSMWLQGRLERPPSSVLRLQGRLERHLSRILRFRGGSRGARRAFCGSRAGSSGRACRYATLRYAHAKRTNPKTSRGTPTTKHNQTKRKSTQRQVAPQSIISIKVRFELLFCWLCCFSELLFC